MIFERIKSIICDEFDINENEITMTTSLSDDLDIDSLDLVDLVMSLEDEFSVELPDEALADMKTVGDIVRYIEEMEYRLNRVVETYNEYHHKN